MKAGLLAGRVGDSGPPPATFAYFAGGYTSSDQTTIDKYVFATDTRSTPSGLATATRGGVGLSDIGTALYICGGTGTQIRKITLAESASTLGDVLSNNRLNGCGLTYVGVAGYDTSGYFGINSGDKVTFSTDTRSTITTIFSTGRWGAGGIEDGDVAGYAAGGTNSSSPATGSSAINKLAFSTETASVLGSGLSGSFNQMAGISDPGRAGLIAGHWNESVTSTTVNKLAFPAETTSVDASTLSTGRGILGGASSPGDAGYMAGGYNGSNQSVCDKWSFPSDTRSTITALSAARRAVAGASA